MDKQFEKTYTLRVCGLPLVSFDYHQAREQSVAETETTPVEIIPAKTDLKEKDGEPLFVVNSLMLHDCFKQLMRTEEESLHAITGSVIGNIRSLDCSPEVRGKTATYAKRVADALGEDLVGICLHGSLARGCYHPATSDVDVVAVTRSHLESAPSVIMRQASTTKAR